ncbi:Alkyl hydroperoxide reductase subunit F [Verticillium dahliae VDG2]|nr:Alkyl hydroperoxide reductase subunit F [Verticillium dahliae VDG2]
MSSSDIQHFRKILPAEADLESAGTTATTSSSASAHAEALPTSLPYPSDTLEESERSKRKRSRTQVSCNDCRRKKIRVCSTSFPATGYRT